MRAKKIFVMIACLAVGIGLIASLATFVSKSMMAKKESVMSAEAKFLADTSQVQLVSIWTFKGQREKFICVEGIRKSAQAQVRLYKLKNNNELEEVISTYEFSKEPCKLLINGESIKCDEKLNHVYDTNVFGTQFK
jgi:hypothetical protein